VEMKESGLTNPAARLFSNPAGDYGSMVNERVGAGNWDSGQELGDTWASRNAFSYGRHAPTLQARWAHQSVLYTIASAPSQGHLYCSRAKMCFGLDVR
jgi:cobalamin biosynthesis Mg chelatase CobN